jgi:hypothetical protein
LKRPGLGVSGKGLSLKPIGSVVGFEFQQIVWQATQKLENVFSGASQRDFGFTCVERNTFFHDVSFAEWAELA